MNFEPECRMLVQAAASLEREHDGAWHTQHEIAERAGFDIETEDFILYMAAAAAQALLDVRWSSANRLQLHTMGERQ